MKLLYFRSSVRVGGQEAYTECGDSWRVKDIRITLKSVLRLPGALAKENVSLLVTQTQNMGK